MFVNNKPTSSALFFKSVAGLYLMMGHAHIILGVLLCAALLLKVCAVPKAPCSASPTYT